MYQPINKTGGGKPQVSIIIPVYNTSKYLRQCLDSVINQSFTNWECIVVDDGSTDNSGIICDEYAAKENKIKVIHKQNGGVSTARNAGLEVSKGTYISFIDGDDYAEPTFIETMLSAMSEYKVDLVCVRIFFDTTKGINQQRNGKLVLLNQRETVTHMLLPSAFHGWPFNKLYKAKIIKENNLTFDPTLKYCEDEVFVLSYIAHIDSCCYLPEALYHYVQNANSANNKIYTSRQFDSRCLDRHKADEISYSIIKGFNDKELERHFKARMFDSYMATSDKLLKSYNGEKDVWNMLKRNLRKYYIYHITNKKFRRTPIIEIKFLIRVISPSIYKKCFM